MASMYTTIKRRDETIRAMVRKWLRDNDPTVVRPAYLVASAQYRTPPPRIVEVTTVKHNEYDWFNV